MTRTNPAPRPEPPGAAIWGVSLLLPLAAIGVAGGFLCLGDGKVAALLLPLPVAVAFWLGTRFAARRGWRNFVTGAWIAFGLWIVMYGPCILSIEPLR